jgi:hypothetical protein
VLDQLKKRLITRNFLRLAGRGVNPHCIRDRSDRARLRHWKLRTGRRRKAGLHLLLRDKVEG